MRLITRVNYLYRDDDNYKQSGVENFSGAICPDDIMMIYEKLEMGEMFVAEQVGLPSLRDLRYYENGNLLVSDNGWHFLSGIEIFEGNNPSACDVETLVEKFRQVDSWNLFAAERQY